VIVTPTEGVRVGAGDPGGVRLCLGAARTASGLEMAMRRLEAILLGHQQSGVAGLKKIPAASCGVLVVERKQIRRTQRAEGNMSRKRFKS
jgi:hypothetical protein